MRNNKSGDEEKTEPKENDKWVENNEHEKDSDLSPKNSRLDQLRGRAKKIASNKNHLIILLLCIIVFIFFIIVISLSIQYGTYKCPESVECRTADCLKAAAQIVERSDFRFDPCDDFWAFSCNGWIQQTIFPDNRGQYSVADLLKNKINKRMRHLIDLVPHNIDPTTHQWKVKQFYTACMNLKDIEYWIPEKIKQAIHEIGGWAIIGDPPGGNWDRNDVLIKLQVTYGVPAFFQLLVEADDADPMRNIIKLVPSGLGLPSPSYYFKPHDDLYVKAYKDFIKNIMQEMGVGLPEANRFAEEIFNYERRIAEITPNPEELRKTKDHYVLLSVNELDRLSTSIPWTKFLQTYFPGIIYPDMQIGLLSEKYFVEISKIISSTDNSVLNNYYMWRFMHSFAPRLSSRYRLIANHLKQTFEGVSNLNIPYEDNWESCIAHTSQILGHAMGSMYVDYYVPKQSQEQIQIYVHKLAGALNAFSHSIPWLADEDTRDNAQSKIRSLLLLIGHPGFAKNRTMDTYYKELRVENNYFQNMKDGVYFMHKKQEEMLEKNAKPDYSWTIYSHDINSDYKYAGNQLIVPAGLFESPLFNFNSPLAVKYGVLAAYVANKLSEMFDNKGIHYDMYGTLKPWMSNHSLLLFKQGEECLKTRISNFSLYNVKIKPDLAIGSLIADLGGLKVAYEAYKRHSREIDNEGELPGTNINNDQLFFISYAQSLCEHIRTEKLRAIKDSSFNLPEELRVLATLQQMPEFSSVFYCPHNSKFSSNKHCRMW